MRLTKELLYGKIIRGFEGTDPEPVAEMLNAVPYGGIIFFRKNILNYSHLGEFIAQLKSRVARPLLLCIDQEMGVVNRIREGLPPLPGGREFAALPREERKESAATLAERLAEAGINVNFAPVCDIPANPEDFIYRRTLGDTPEEVCQALEDWLEGFRNSGILSVLKHFPGHGNTKTDSHLGLPVKETSWQEWLNRDALPFLHGMELGGSGLMLAHILYPNIDGEPLPLSPVFLRYLRHTMGFRGPLFTDDLEMEGFLSLPDWQERFHRLLVGTVDYLILGKNLPGKVDEVKIVEELLATSSLS